MASALFIPYIHVVEISGCDLLPDSNNGIYFKIYRNFTAIIVSKTAHFSELTLGLLPSLPRTTPTRILDKLHNATLLSSNI